MTNERLMTTTEIAAALHVTRQTVTRWIRDGHLHVISIKVGKRITYRVPEREFRRFLREYVEGLD
jgi:excisionase family DNA binding protein